MEPTSPHLKYVNKERQEWKRFKTVAGRDLLRAPGTSPPPEGSNGASVIDNEAILKT